MERPTVGIWSGQNALAIALAEKLLANLCEVVVVNKNIASWQEATKHFSNSPYFRIQKNEDGLAKIDYSCVLGAPYKEALRIEEKYRAKTFLILDYRELQKRQDTFHLKENIGAVYVGDLFGPRMDLDSSSSVARIVEDVLFKKKVEVSLEDYVYPIPIPEAVNLIVRWLFSFGPYGEEIALLGPQVSTKEFYSEITRIVSGTSFLLQEKKSPELHKNIARYTLKTNNHKWLTETFAWFLKYRPTLHPAIRKEEKIILSPKARRLTLRPVPLVILLLLILLSPLLILALSAFFLGTAFSFLKLNNFTMAQKALGLAAGASVISLKESSLFSAAPIVGRPYRPIVFLSQLTHEVSLVGEDTIALAQTSRRFFLKVFGNEVYNPASYTQEMQADLDGIYQKLSFLQSEIESASGFESKLVARIVKPGQITDLRELVGESRGAVLGLPEILGITKKKTYLVLLQNNMELRPTGGFIGSYALITFDGGKLSDITVSDVYSADGQLKGHVEPPDPIKKYLKEGGWYLRDSNWDPDFPSTASKAEWFLDKEIDQSVDGVISVDLETIKLLLDEVGPIIISDFNMVIDSKNLYEKTQAEVQENFFPGSQKKGSFLTALTRQLFNTISYPKDEDYLGAGKAIYKSLEEKHIQIFLHDSASQKSIEELGWDGAVFSPTCPGNCYADWFGIVEANVGVNKANYFIVRKAFADVTLTGQTIKRRLVLSLSNQANPALGEKAKYKTYIRLLVGATSAIENALLSAGEDKTSIVPEVNLVHGRKEAGLYIEVAPQEDINLTFVWNDSSPLNFSKIGEYRLLWRKQSGTGADQIVFILHLPLGTLIDSLPTPSLTRGANVSYNTSLARDFEMKASW
jgi:hypothetical protein